MIKWFKIGKGVGQSCTLSPYLFNFYAEYNMWDAGLDKAQTRIKISRRNINNLIHADDTSLKAERKEALKSLLEKLNEETENAGLKHNIQKTKIMETNPITLWQIDGGEN